MRHYELPGRIIKPTETLPAPLKSNWGWTRLNDPPHSRSNIGISGDSWMLGTDWSHNGFFFGFTIPGIRVAPTASTRPTRSSKTTLISCNAMPRASSAASSTIGKTSTA